MQFFSFEYLILIYTIYVLYVLYNVHTLCVKSTLYLPSM